MALLQHLVVVIPDTGGSVLETARGSPVWGHGHDRSASALVNPARLSLLEHPRLRPVNLLGSTRIFPWKVVAGYGSLISNLMTKFGLSTDDIDTACGDRKFKPAASVMLFPYDFRLGVIEAAGRLAWEVRQRLDNRTDKRHSVIVLAHAMGGLVARYWLGPLRGARYCRALMTLGTPYRGAPNALDWLFNGVRVGPTRAAAPTSTLLANATAVLQEWQSTYDLLPCYRAVRDEKTGNVHYPYELGSASFQKRALVALEMHREIKSEWEALEPAQRPQVLALFARGHATFSRAVIRNGRVRVTKSDPEWLSHLGWRGDGTVPALSAIPIELTNTVLAPRAVPDRHGPMATSTVAVDLLQNYQTKTFDGLHGHTPNGAWLGLDLDEVIAVSQPFIIRAQLLGRTNVEDTSVWLRVAAETDPITVAKPIRMARTENWWETTVPGLSPGRYQISVEARNVPPVDRVLAGDVIGVIEP